MTKLEVTRYWLDPPPEPSLKLGKWIAKLKARWRPNRRIRSMGYHEAAEYYGVYIWEYINVISPIVNQKAND